MQSGQELRNALLGTAVTGKTGVRCFLRELLSEGGQGWVFKANHLEPSGVWVAVKMLRPEPANEEARARFERETEALKTLSSISPPDSNIVRLLDRGEHPISASNIEILLPFVVLEYVAGRTLEQMMREAGGAFAVARVHKLMRQLARALQTVHDQQIVHRDVKPGNILIADEGGQDLLKITDFGLAKMRDASVYQTGTFAGASLGYAPPEQYEMGNARVSAQTDIFSMAAILFELLAGQEAFPCKPGDNALRVMARMQTADRPSLARAAASLPRELRDRPDILAALDREIARATGPDPVTRHASVKDFWARTEPLLRELLVRLPAAAQSESVDTGARPTALPQVRMPMPAWRAVVPPLRNEQLRAAVFISGGSIVAVGARGLFCMAAGQWSAMQMPPAVDTRLLRSVIKAPSGKLVLMGDTSLIAIVHESGEAERLYINERDMTLLGGFADAEGLVLVGEKLSRSMGAAIILPWGGVPQVLTIEGSTRLYGAVRAGPQTLLVCGAHGALFEIQGGAVREIAWGRTGHLFAMVPAPQGGAYVVGSGGHALRLVPVSSPSADQPGHTALLEAVQTTRDLKALALDSMGKPWAAGTQARLMQRVGDVWIRVPLDPKCQTNLVAASVREDLLFVLAEDGTLYEASRVA